MVIHFLFFILFYISLYHYISIALHTFIYFDSFLNLYLSFIFLLYIYTYLLFLFSQPNYTTKSNYPIVATVAKLVPKMVSVCLSLSPSCLYLPSQLSAVSVWLCLVCFNCLTMPSGELLITIRKLAFAAGHTGAVSRRLAQIDR